MARESTSPLASVFVSDAIPKILATLDTLGPQSAAEIAERVEGISARSVRTELDRLYSIGLLTTKRIHKVRVFEFSRHALVPHFVSISIAAYGPPWVIADCLRAVSGVERAFIFGSWAKRYHGVHGRLPNDIDVFLVGEINRSEMIEATENASKRLGPEVNARRVSVAEWESPSDAFLRIVQQEPLVEIELPRRSS